MWMSIAKGARYACCDNVTFRAMVMQGVIPRYPSLNPNSSREVVRSEDIDAAIMARGAVRRCPRPTACHHADRGRWRDGRPGLGGGLPPRRVVGLASRARAQRRVRRGAHRPDRRRRRHRGDRAERDVLLAPIYLDSCIAIGAAARGREPPYGTRNAARMVFRPLRARVHHVLRPGTRYIRSAVRMSAMSAGAAAPPMNPAMAPETTLNSATR